MYEQSNLRFGIVNSIESMTISAVAPTIWGIELKKILIDKIESNKSIHGSDEQKNLYKALVDAYESDKLILDTYEDIVSFKRRRDDEDKDKEPSVGSNRGSKRRRAGKEPESTSAPKEKTSKTTDGKIARDAFNEIDGHSPCLLSFCDETTFKYVSLTPEILARSNIRADEGNHDKSLRGFIYQNKDKKNKLMRIDELHKFSDGTLNDVRTALDDRLKGIRMKYLPQTI
ncbi:hypothetical protein Tco_0247705 [Tanacetum coccineum]